ncbi:MAG TPA: LytTR family DNA-binding domain-containing protein [Bacteroidales bacterium]|nr:LytTR family DNA-binding domain-containing protein [Bacteroidales bacterium]
MDSKLKALIVDDEEDARKLLKKLLDETHMFSDLKLADSACSATSELKNYDPDMIFLDIRMPEKDGFDFLMDMNHRNGRPGIVFVSAYEQHALKAIKHQAFDYLLKPVNRKELKQCINKYISSRNESFSPLTQIVQKVIPDKIKRVKVSTRTGTLFINPANILYCKADGNYTIIFTGGKELLCSMNIGKMREMLPENIFLRIGRSLIINLEFITHLDRKQSVLKLVSYDETVSVKVPRNHLKELDTI